MYISGSSVYEWYQELPGEARGGGAGRSHRERKSQGTVDLADVLNHTAQPHRITGAVRIDGLLDVFLQICSLTDYQDYWLIA